MNGNAVLFLSVKKNHLKMDTNDAKKPEVNKVKFALCQRPVKHIQQHLHLSICVVTVSTPLWMG